MAACQSNVRGPSPAQGGYPAPGQPAPSVISENEFEQLRDELVSVRAQRKTLADNLPRVTDPARRADHIRSIGVLDDNARLLEFRLRSAGRPVR